MPNDLTELVERVRLKSQRTPSELAQYENHLEEIRKTALEIRSEIGKHIDRPEQTAFTWMPTPLTRVSPFYPLSKREQKRDRPLEMIRFENPWGVLEFQGQRLSVYDESILLALLHLARTRKVMDIDTTPRELATLLKIGHGSNTFDAIWGALKRLTGTTITLRLKTGLRMTNSILAGAIGHEENGKIRVSINPYFAGVYMEGLITNISLDLRSSLKGDIAKGLYRFLVGQRPNPYQAHLLTLSAAINLDITAEPRRLRVLIRRGLSELRKAGFLKHWKLDKSDLVSTWK